MAGTIGAVMAVVGALMMAFGGPFETGSTSAWGMIIAAPFALLAIIKG